jgi:N6-L-threonylcarbamoyladenine synthase
MLSNVVASQVNLHHQWGGVVPEAAARAHVEAILPTLELALSDARISANEVEAVAVTNRPGLIGALSVGVSVAKAFAFRNGLPIVGVNHLHGHLCSVLALETDIVYPHLAMIVSGGHSEFVRCEGPTSVQVLGGTRDDAAGEAFDKGARLLGLGYPGGIAIQEAAKSGDPKRYRLPVAQLGDGLELSFSGLKTAVLRLVEKEAQELHVPSAAFALQQAVVSALSQQVTRAIETGSPKALALVGGVAANELLRTSCAEIANRYGIPLYAPPLSLCTDNAAMIALAGSVLLAKGPSLADELEASSYNDLSFENYM